jgi:hypothetical protein
MGADLLAALTAHADRLARDWDAAAAADPEMLEVARQVAARAADGDADAWRAVGQFYLNRAAALPAPGGGWSDDLEAATDAFTRCFLAGGEVPDQVRAGIAVSAAGRVREQWLEAEQSPEIAPLTAVARRWQQIVAALPVDSPYRAEYLSYLGATLFSRYQRSGELADLDGAVTMARQAADTVAPDDETRPASATSWPRCWPAGSRPPAARPTWTRRSPPTRGSASPTTRRAASWR